MSKFFSRSFKGIVLALMLILICPYGFSFDFGNDDKIEQARNDLHAVAQAIRNYYYEYGFYPAGDNKRIIATLTGANSHGVVFIGIPRNINAKGEFIDPWGTPYMIGVLSPHHIVLRSAGPNRIFKDPKSINEDLFP